MTTDKQHKILNVPPLRFPEFSGKWEKKRIRDLFCINVGGDIDKKEVSSIRTERFKYPIIANALTNDGVYGYTSSYKDDAPSITVTGRGDIGNAKYRSLPLYPIVRLLVLHSLGEIDCLFGEYAINHIRIYEESTGVPQLTSPQLGAYYIMYPSRKEQQKIGSFLSLLDNRIKSQNKIIEDLKTLKSAIRKQMFSELLLDKEPDLQIKDVLDYEQPTKYLVSDTEYSNDKTLVPVLTANKAFILGYTDETHGIYTKGKCIILDDFTLDCKFVDFPFKVKSSAIKILTAKIGVNIRYLYEYLKFLELDTSEHKRHYIAEIEPLEIVMPDIDEANNIANTLEVVDRRIDIAERILALYQSQKQYLLQQMFI